MVVQGHVYVSRKFILVFDRMFLFLLFKLQKYNHHYYLISENQILKKFPPFVEQKVPKKTKLKKRLIQFLKGVKFVERKQTAWRWLPRQTRFMQGAGDIQRGVFRRAFALSP